MTGLLGSLAERSVSGAATLACELDLRGAAPGPGGRYGRRGGGAADRRGQRDGTGDDGPRAGRIRPTRHAATLVSLPDGGLVTLGVFACARNRPVAAPALNDQQKCPGLTLSLTSVRARGPTLSAARAKKEKQGGCQAIALYTFSTRARFQRTSTRQLWIVKGLYNYAVNEPVELRLLPAF